IRVKLLNSSQATIAIAIQRAGPAPPPSPSPPNTPRSGSRSRSRGLPPPRRRGLRPSLPDPPGMVQAIWSPSGHAAGACVSRSILGGGSALLNQQRLQRRAPVVVREAHGIGMREVQVEGPAVLVVGFAADRADLVQARAQPPGMRRQAQLGADPAQAEPGAERGAQQVDAE